MRNTDLKNKIESILITEITRLYVKASAPLGLDAEDVKKLESLVKIYKNSDADDEDGSSKPKPTTDLSSLMKIAREKDGK